jgi:hypothetical protein
MDLATATAIRAEQAAQQARQVAEFATTRPTPSPAEANALANTPGAIFMNKRWDLSPVTQTSPDPTEPPGRPVPPPPPFNTAPPVITALDGLEVGDQLVGAVGSWSGAGLSYTRQWMRGALPLVGQTGGIYTLSAPDVGYAITMAVVATTSAGAKATCVVEFWRARSRRKG